MITSHANDHKIDGRTRVHRHNCWWHRDIAGATATPALAQGGVYFEGPGFGVGVGRPAFRADAEQQEALFSDAIGLEVFDTTLQTANTWLDEIDRRLELIAIDTAHQKGKFRTQMRRKLNRHSIAELVRHGQIEKVKAALPADLRAFWVAIEERVVAPPDRSSESRRHDWIAD